MRDPIAQALAANLNPNSLIGSLGFSPSLVGARLVSRQIVTANGQNDLYTVPTGKRAMIIRVGVFNPTGGSISGQMTIGVSGTYYPLRDVQAVAASTPLIYTTSFVMEAGDVFSFNNTAPGLNLRSLFVEFSNTSSFKTVRLLSIVSGDQTLYTAPSSRGAIIANGLSIPGSGGVVGIYNNSGGTRNFGIFHTAAGVTASSSANRIVSDIPITNASASVGAQAAGLTGLQPTESVVIHSDGAGAGMFWMTLTELPFG